MPMRKMILGERRSGMEIRRVKSLRKHRRYLSMPHRNLFSSDDVLLKGVQVTALIDSRSTHNFIDMRLAKYLQLIPDPNSRFMVQVANGEKTESQGKCAEIPLQFPNVVTPVDFLLLRLTGCDLVLGVQWLCEVNPIQWDFVEQIMRFDYKGKQECLSGITNNKWEVISADDMAMEMKTANHIDVIQLLAIELQVCTTDVKSEHHPKLESLLNNYEDLFVELNSLPPERLQDHQIPLKPGTAPISVRPYQYSLPLEE